MEMKLATDVDFARRLKLSDLDLQALTGQGRVMRESLPSGNSCYKLRWRTGQRQRVRYLGVDSRFAKKVNQWLGRLQHRRRERKHFASIARGIRQDQRTMKREIQEKLSVLGLKSHGYALRQSRRPTWDCTSNGASREIPAASQLRRLVLHLYARQLHVTQTRLAQVMSEAGPELLADPILTKTLTRLLRQWRGLTQVSNSEIER